MAQGQATGGAAIPQAGSIWQVPLADVQVGPEEVAAVAEVLQGGWLSQGPRVERFEAEFARFVGAREAIAVANGTAALHLACLALGLQPGDEVLCPALTFVATANAIRYTGATPMFVDLAGLKNLNLSPENAEKKISGRTRALMVVHYGGYAADMAALLELAERHQLAIVEDCAHAPGTMCSTRRGRIKAGTAGSLGCFSFFSNKNMTTGEGGMVVTDDPELAAKVRTGRSHGMTTLTWDRHRGHSFSYDVAAPGYNYRLDEMRAALGIVQLGRVEEFNARRRELTQAYREKLGGVNGLEIPFKEADPQDSACHLFPVLLPRGADRTAFMAFCKDRGIQTSIHYPPIHHFSYYRGLWPADFDHGLPVTEEVAAREVSLPLFPAMTEAQVELVVAAVADFFRSV